MRIIKCKACGKEAAMTRNEWLRSGWQGYYCPNCANMLKNTKKK